MAGGFVGIPSLELAKTGFPPMTEGARAGVLLDAGERTAALVTGLVATLLFGLTAVLFGGQPEGLAAIPLAALTMLLLTSIELSFVALVVVFFADIHVSIFSSAVWFSPVVFMAFLLNHRDFAWKELANPLTASIVVYGLAILPSFVNAVDPVQSGARLFNVAAFLFALVSAGVGVRTHGQLGRIVGAFLLMAFVNGVALALEALGSGKRAFGFAGIMYVDYSGLAVCVSAAMVLCARGIKRVLLLSLCLAIGVAHILTQTRNAWLSTIITLLLLAGYLVVHPEMIGSTRRKLLGQIVIGVTLIAAMAGGVVIMNPTVEQRATNLVDVRAVETGDDIDVKNSLITRMLIWDTALNAFLAHPVAGVGVYGFYLASRQYARMPPILYRRFVEGNSAHQTYFAVLTETGIVGMAGFLVFLVAMLRLPFRVIRQAEGHRGRQYGLVGAVAVAYCAVSMLFTDAWLWGQGIVLLGLILGLVHANGNVRSVAA
jgi:O-antigen ligase